jgi:hypothetical protein
MDIFKQVYPLKNVLYVQRELDLGDVEEAVVR